MKDRIPEYFYKANSGQKPCFTVGELIDELQKLPRELRIEHGFGEGTIPKVYNINDNPSLEFNEVDDD